MIPTRAHKTIKLSDTKFEDRSRSRTLPLFILVIVVFLLNLYYFNISLFIYRQHIKLNFSRYSVLSTCTGDTGVIRHGFRIISAKMTLFSNESPSSSETTSVLDPTQACQIPQVDPFDSSIKALIKDPKKGKHLVLCQSSTIKQLFVSVPNSTLIPVPDIGKKLVMKNMKPCYKVITRKKPPTWPPDDGYDLSDECYNISLTTPTTIPDEHEFIIIFPQPYKYKLNGKGKIPTPIYRALDMHAFVPMKPSLKVKDVNVTESPPSGPKLNVIIFGIDSVSRANFIRHMPKSFDFIKKKLNAVEMTGYNKIGDNTLPNLAPFLTGLTKEQLDEECSRTPYSTFDGCPFIWKNFSKAGYKTGFAEDAPQIAIFNCGRQGFRKQPTDYYLRPFDLVNTKSFARRQGLLCQGPRLYFETLLDYMKKFVYTMNNGNEPHFFFSWASALTHDILEAPLVVDGKLMESMKWLMEENHLNNTLFILMSDHGIRAGPIKKLVQGQVEDRLPFMYFVFPEWFKKTYRRAFANFRSNAGRLTTTLDFHYTLMDLLNPKSMEDNEVIMNRENDLETKFKNEKSIPKGISLFLPIPRQRLCEHTIIEPNFCSCHKYEMIPKHHSIAEAGAKFAVTEINKLLLKDRMTRTKCANLTLKFVLFAQKRVVMNERTSTSRLYLLNFRASPSNGDFEALVEYVREMKTWKLLGPLVRTNSYGSQSRCVNDSYLKLFCYCHK